MKTISNLFYSGFVTHFLIPGEIIKGHHPALISEVAFLSANRAAAAEPRNGIAKKFKIDDLPLKTFAKADHSNASALVFADMVGYCEFGSGGNGGNPFTGYLKKGNYYYKTRGKGKAINVRATHLNKLFFEELQKFEFNKKHTSKLKEEIARFVTEELKEHTRDQVQIKKQLTELNKKIEGIEECFVSGELPKDLYEKYKLKYESEKKELEKTLKTDFDSSNLKKTIEKVLENSQNISARWASGDYDEKQKFQNIIFPEGILYNKQKDKVRALKVNFLFPRIPRVVSFLEGNEKSHPFENGSNSIQVDTAGIELFNYYFNKKAIRN